MFPFHKTLACFAVGVIALVAVEAGQVHEQVLEQLEGKLDEQFVGDFKARQLTGTLLWGFTAHDVEIRDSRGEPVAHIEELQVEASAFELLEGNLRFDGARFVRPSVLLERYADGTNNVDEVFRSRRPGSDSRPSGKVLFEMTHAQVIDGRLIHTEASQPAPSAALGYLGADLQGEDAAMSVTSARALDVEGSFRVIAGKQTETVIDRLDAEVFSDEEPRQLSVKRARIDTDAGAFRLSADTLAVDDRWRIEDFWASRAGKFGADLVSLRARATSPGGGWLQIDGRIDCDDASYALALEAEEFAAADWPGAPDWSWLVLDGAGEISGRGWSREEMDATVRWTASSLDVAGEYLERLDLVAQVADRRVDVETLDVAAADFSASASGHVSESGAFSIEVDALADGAFAKRLANRLGAETVAANKLVANKISAELRDVAQFELSTKATGALALSGPGGLQRLEHARVDTTWKTHDVILDKTRWGVAGGGLSVHIPKAPPRGGRTKRRFSYKGSAVLHDVHHRALDADILRTSVHGDAVLGRDAALEGLSYELEVDFDGVALGEHQAKEARLEVKGALSPAAEAGDWPLEALAAEGTLDLVEYRSPDMRARRVATNIDVSGAFPVGQGRIVAHMTGLRANDRRFRHARMELRLLEDQKFRFKSKARVEVSLIPDLPLYLDISGRHGRDFKALSLDKLRFGRPGMRWKTRKPGLVRFEDGAVVLQALTLHRRSQRVRLDGDYGHGKKGSISDICSRLKNAQLRSFFDLSGIKRGLRNIF